MFSKVILITILLIAGSQAHLESAFDRLQREYNSESVTIQDSQADVLAFIKGFLEGVGTSNVFDEIRACIRDSREVEDLIIRGLGLIQTKNPENVKEGIKFLGQAVQVIPVAAVECKSAHADIMRLIKLIQSFTDPKSFLYHVGRSLLINRVEVFNEVKHIVEAYEKKDYHDIGFWTGRAMATIFMSGKNKLRQSMVDFINSENAGWTAEITDQFAAKTLDELSANLIPLEMMDSSKIKDLNVMDYEGLKNDYPPNFDTRTRWPGCVHEIRDQGKCGSCWAFAASEVLSDRYCIASNRRHNVILSPQYLVSCNNVLNHGCNGGNPFIAWKFLELSGIVTDECLPYQSGNGTNPVRCRDFTTCTDGSRPVHYYATKGSTAILPNPASIQAQLFEHGPVEAAFTVYEDFMAYKSGIYRHVTGKALGGHAVKIVGWGEENGTQYWIAANSWTTRWGERGFFRIAFGECGFDSQCSSAEADLTRVQQSNADFF